MKLLITGGCGFVGHHFVEHFLKTTDWEIIVLDKLSYASSGFDRLRDIDCFDNSRVRIFPIDLTMPVSEGVKKEIGQVEYIINMASASHVDNSIEDPVPFVQNNINLMLYLLEWCRTLQVRKFIQFSTDEVYGTAPTGVNYCEGDRTNPGNPYSASKAAQESICRAYANTYGLPIIITNTMNVIGERQHPEKFVPLVIRKVTEGETVQVHADETRCNAGTRFYIHARNVADAIHFLLSNETESLDNIDASKGQYNIVGEREIDNLLLAQTIAEIIGNPLQYEMCDFHSSRPGHDLRYALDGEKIKKAGWESPKGFEESLQKTVNWTIKNDRWYLKS